MQRLTARDFHPQLLELYDGYVHGGLGWRDFLDRAAKYAVGGMTAAAILAALSPDYALAQQIALTDPDIQAAYVRYPSPEGHGKVRGYLVRPARANGAVPGIVVVHENRGLNPYIEDVARRVSKAGFVALAPDGLSSVGGYPGNGDQGRELQQQVDPHRLMNDFFAAIDHLRASDMTTDRIGITGFCYGGGVANAASVAHPELAAAVPFYGRQARPGPRTCRASGHRCCCISPRPTRTSMPHGRHTRRRSRLPAGPTRPTSIRTPGTGSTTTPRRATTRRPPSSRGAGPSPGSGAIWPDAGRPLRRRA